MLQNPSPAVSRVSPYRGTRAGHALFHGTPATFKELFFQDRNIFQAYRRNGILIRDKTPLATAEGDGKNDDEDNDDNNEPTAGIPCALYWAKCFTRMPYEVGT